MARATQQVRFGFPPQARPQAGRFLDGTGEPFDDRLELGGRPAFPGGFSLVHTGRVCLAQPFVELALSLHLSIGGRASDFRQVNRSGPPRIDRAPGHGRDLERMIGRK
jgi:hypothetical protein